MEYYIAQIFGSFALLILFTSYQKNTKKDFLGLQILSNTLYGIQYFCLNAYSALASNVVSAVKNVVFYRYSKNDKKIPIVILIVFELIMLVSGIYTYDGIHSIIPIVVSCVYTYGTWQNELKFTYIIGAGAAILWIIYNIIVSAHIAIIGSVIELIGSVLGLRKLICERKEKKC